MAQNLTIAGARYQAVPAVDIPKTGGGTARFMDTSDATATADKIKQGYSAYVDGTKVSGTATDSTIYTATIPHLSSSWTEQGGIPFCAITVNGLLASDNPIIDVLVDFENPDIVQIVQAVEDWGLCLSANAYANNTLVVVFSDIPSVDIPIKILCIRK